MVIFKSDRKLYLKSYFYVKPNIRKYMELFTSTNEATLIKLSNFAAIIMKKFSVQIVFPNDETKYVPNYMKINRIFFVFEGQFPVMDYISNTKILYFIVVCINVSCLFYILYCLHQCIDVPRPLIYDLNLLFVILNVVSRIFIGTMFWFQQIKLLTML